MISTSGKHQNNLLLLLSKNQVCFDCTAKSPTCANMTIGSFVCMQCAGLLREFGHRIKSVTASTFTPEEVSDLSHKGNDYAAKTWLAVWIESDDPKPKRDNPKKIREFMKKKYELKSFYWDGSTSRATDPSQLPTLIDRKETHDILSIPPSSRKDPVFNHPGDDFTQSKLDNSWADFASAFPGSNKSSPPKKEFTTIKEKQDILLTPNIIYNIVQKDIQLDPFESTKTLNNAGKYDAFKDLVGLSLSETAPKLSTSLKKFTNKALDLSKFVEDSSACKSKHSWEKNSDLLPVEEKSSFSLFEMNPFAFDSTPCEKVQIKNEDSKTTNNYHSLQTSAPASKSNTATLDTLEYNEWNTPNDDSIDEMNHLQSVWTDNDHNANPIDPTLQDMGSQDIHESNPDLQSELKDFQSSMESQWHHAYEVDSNNYQETSSSTLVEGDVNLNDKVDESVKYQFETGHNTQAYVPYELDSNVWG